MGPILTDEQLDRALLDHFVERRAEIVAAAPSSHEVASRIDARAVSHARVDTYGARRLAWLVLVAALLTLTAWTISIIGEATPEPRSFEAGSIAFARGADLYVTRADGSRASKVATGPADSMEVRELAIAPDRTAIAYVRVTDATVGAQELVIVDAAGETVGSYRGAAQGPDPIDIIFSWAPDGQRLAVFPGQTDREIALIGRDGKPLGRLELPDEDVISPRLGVRGRLHIGSRPGSWREVATLAWSPDASWIAVPVWGTNGPPSCATKGMEFETCYLLFASDGTATVGLTDEAGGFLAWAPDGRVAVAHAYAGTVQVWTSLPDSVAQDAGLPHTIPLPSQPFGHALAWSPDGSRLLVGGQFYAQGGDDAQPFICDCVQLYTIGADRSPVALSRDPVDGFLGMVAWAPGGDRILFSTSSDGGPEPVGASIWSIDADGGTATKLTDTTEVIFDVAIGADP